MKILIADDHQLLADALAQLVKEREADSQVLQAGTLDDAMSAMEREGPVEIVLLDYDLPGMDGGAGLDLIRRTHPQIPCAIFSGEPDVDTVQTALSRGAAGIIPKNMSAPAFFHAIKLIQVGEKFVPASLYGVMADSSEAQRQDAVDRTQFVAVSGLSPREVDVLAALVKGISNREIGRELGVEEVTIKLHLRRIYKKIGVANRTQAVKLAMANGFA